MSIRFLGAPVTFPELRLPPPHAPFNMSHSLPATPNSFGLHLVQSHLLLSPHPMADQLWQDRWLRELTGREGHEGGLQGSHDITIATRLLLAVHKEECFLQKLCLSVRGWKSCTQAYLCHASCATLPVPR